jgi:hypothetical protein
MNETPPALLITEPGVSVSNATPQQVILNSNNPFIKIDTQNQAGFQTIELIITTDPPEPAAGSVSYTVLYQFKHGYNYVPSIESLFYVQSPPPAPYSNGTQTYFQDSGRLGADQVGTEAYAYALADNQNVYIICQKYNDSGTGTLLTGTNLQVTLHVFCEDIGV